MIRDLDVLSLSLFKVDKLLGSLDKLNLLLLFVQVPIVFEAFHGLVELTSVGSLLRQLLPGV